MTNAEHLAGLEGDALDVAREALRRWPTVVIVSSLRATSSQAHAMATNVIEHAAKNEGERNWIELTYFPSLAARRCNAWALQNDVSLERMAEAFTSILEQLPDGEIEHLSKHLAAPGRKARAVDFEPPGSPELCAYLEAEAKARGGRFLQREGGLVRCHWQAGDRHSVRA